MTNRYENMLVSGVGEIDGSTASRTLISAPGSALYLFLQSLSISVSKAAVGGGGEVLVQDTNGNVVWRANADGVKDLSPNFGEEGIRLGPGVGIVASVVNAQGTQATASVAAAGYLSFQ